MSSSEPTRTGARLPEALAALLARELRTLRREVERYPDDQAPWREAGGFPNTAGTLVLHLAGNLRHYVGARLGGSGYVRDRDAEFATRGVSRAALVAEIDRTIADVERALASLPEGALDAEYPEIVGGHALRTREFLLHLLAHLAYHLGQVDCHRRIVTGDAAAVGAIGIAEAPSSVRQP